MRDRLIKLIAANAVQIALLLAVLVVFVGNAAGILDLSAGGFQIRTARASDGSLVLPAVTRSAEFVTLMLVGCVLCVSLPLLPPVWASLLALAAAVPFFAFELMSTGRGTPLLPMEFGMLTVGVLYVMNVLMGYFGETRAKQRIIGSFGQYVPPQVVEEIARHPDSLSMEGQAKELTVFFCDLQEFTAVAEQLNPKQLTLLLNEYFDEMTEILYRYGATIDKYIGDSIMAFWGAPLPQPDHARRAVLASFEMQQAIAKLSDTFSRRGWPAPPMGIGINTGMMNVGNMGSRYRIAYTVIGDAVNLASRLETLTRIYRVPTIVGERTRLQCDGIAFRTLDIVQVRGKRNRTRIYQPVCEAKDLSGMLRDRLGLHEQGVEAMISGDPEEARRIFDELHRTDAGDRYYETMLRRLAETVT
jgi:adenylate cyclase